MLRGRWRWHLAAIDVAVPVAVYLVRIGRWPLDLLNAPRLLSLDWTTYIAAPNFLRTAPILTMPIGEIPDYLAPAGASLGLADASPMLMPLYRVLNAIFPDQPTQLLGWILLFSYVATYLWSVRFLRRAARSVGNDGWPTEVGARLAGVMMLVLPFFAARIVHISLTHQWVIIAAAYFAVFEPRPDPRTDRKIALLTVVAAALHPYLVPQVLVVSAPYLVRRVRHAPVSGLLWCGLVVAISASVTLAFGFAGGDVAVRNGGYGMFSADALFLISTRGSSHTLPALSWDGPTFLGLGFLGLGQSAIVIVALLLAVRHRHDRASPSPWRAPLLAAGGLAVFATFPTIRAGGRTVLDLSDTVLSLAVIGDVFRANERFVWPLCWLLALWGCSRLLQATWRPDVVLAVLCTAMLLQLLDVRAMPFTDRGDADYRQVAAVVATARADGAQRIEVQPPYIPYNCFTGDVVPPDDLAPLLVAAAVERMPINSGYPARPVASIQEENCGEQVARFAAGERHADVLYVLPVDHAASAAMVCGPLIGRLVACRWQG